MATRYDSLLNEIQQITSCFYISDLRVIRPDKAACTLIAQIPDNRYSLKEWNAAAAYMSGKELSFTSIAEVKSFFFSLNA